jgi:hypothetical protein
MFPNAINLRSLLPSYADIVVIRDEIDCQTIRTEVSMHLHIVSVNSIFYLFLIVLKLKPLYLFPLMCEASDLKALLMICKLGKNNGLSC